MQRYRVVIMLVLFGVLPVVAAFFVAPSFLEERDEEPAQAEVAPIVEAPTPASEPPPKHAAIAATRALPVGALLGKDDLTGLSIESSDERSDPSPTASLPGGWPTSTPVARVGIHEIVPSPERPGCAGAGPVRGSVVVT